MLFSFNKRWIFERIRLFSTDDWFSGFKLSIASLKRWAASPSRPYSQNLS